VDQRYDALQARLSSVETITTSTLMIQGATTAAPTRGGSEGQQRFFSGPYERVVLAGVATSRRGRLPDAVVSAAIRHLRNA
jgi:hypothetical protein